MCNTLNSGLVFGGNDGEQDLSHVERFDLDSNHWIEMKSMKMDRNGANCCIF
jgi:hypothetical protein